MTFRVRENDIKIDFVLIEKQHRQSMGNVKAIPVEFQHSLVVADIDKKCSEKDMRCEKKDRFAERCEDQQAI